MVRESEANARMLSMMHLSPTLDWVKIAEGQGVPPSRGTTAEEFLKQFEARMGTKGPRTAEAVFHAPRRRRPDTAGVLPCLCYHVHR
jgi:acetolactate synthase-1/2/3 large subunit